MLEHDGAYYCGFKFTIPPWLDGDLEWMFVMAKTEAQKDFISHSTSWYILPENGHNWGFDKLRSDKTEKLYGTPTAISLHQLVTNRGSPEEALNARTNLRDLVRVPRKRVSGHRLGDDNQFRSGERKDW